MEIYIRIFPAKKKKKKQKWILLFIFIAFEPVKTRMDFFLKTVLVDGAFSQDGTRLLSHFILAAPTVSKLHADFSFLSV